MDLFNTGIRPLIDDWLLEKSKKERDYGDYWSASSAGMCQRLVIMRRLGVSPVPEIQEGKARLQRVFQSGHLFHEFFQRITKDAGLSIASEVELQDEELMIRGHFDDLVLIKDMGELEAMPADRTGDNPLPVHNIKQRLILYDYKSQNSKAFNYKRGMSHTHRMQLGTYMYMLQPKGKKTFFASENLELTLPVTEARILKFDKDTMRMEEEQLLWSPELESDVLNYWKGLNEHWKKKTLPKCTCADYDGGYMSRRTKDGRIFNDYFYQDEPCSLEYYNKWKKEKQDGGN